ncbi:DUF3012 domain-containing protein [Haliea sp. E17]|uniref:DUF3012 domain-containing protein n=1 Tax=Haliea sp. E17 TaxID=3401576 RepID=UPI003AB03F78
MKKILTVAIVLGLAACSAEPGSKKWCEAKAEQPKSEWSGSDATTYLANCVIEGSEVGSERWCKKLEEKPKGDWTSNEAASYAKHCVM